MMAKCRVNVLRFISAGSSGHDHTLGMDKTDSETESEEESSPVRSKLLMLARTRKFLNTKYEAYIMILLQILL